VFGVVEASRKALGREGSPTVQAKHGQRVASTRAALGEVAFAASSAKGRAMTLEQAVEYALAGNNYPNIPKTQQRDPA
jgi:hypothetical protein